MSKVYIVLMSFLLLFIVVACDESGGERPDFEGQVKEDIEDYFEDKEWDLEFSYRVSDERDESNVFIQYMTYSERDEYAHILVSATIIDEDELFEIVDMEYDGPRLDDNYFDMDYYTYDENESVYIGGGGAFEVTYESGHITEGGGCIDGDTSIFDYPESVYDKITSNTPSTRYLNIDTPETYPPGEEEAWGQPATQYVCDLLDKAESIVLQTDPGDNLLGNHGRLLGWVWVKLPKMDDYELLNYNVVRQGLATVAFEFGAGETDGTVYDDIRYNEWMHLAEERAENEARGMFSEDLKDPYWDYDNDGPHPERWPR